MAQVDVRISIAGVNEQIVLHLFEIKAVEGPDDHPMKAVPESRTQDGIASACGFSRPFATRELDRAERKGVVTAKLSHVEGQDRRKMAYVLTFQGVQIAEKVKQRDESQTHFENIGGIA
jgi:hypothetical protein